MIQNKKIIITGLNSSISKKFIFYLEKSILNSDIYIFTNRRKKNLQHKNKKIFFLKNQYLDLHKYKKILDNCDYFFHFAYQNSELFAQENPLKDFQINCNGLQNILRETQNNKKLKFIFISTASIYQTSKKIVNENSKLEILSYYNLHKFYCENLIKLFSNFSKNKFIILRLSNVYGDYDLKKRDFLLDCINKITKNISINIYGTGKYFRDFIHIDDVAKALIKIMRNNLHNKIDTFNLCSGKSIKLIDLIKLILKENNKIGSKYTGKIKFYKNSTKLIKRNFLSKPFKFSKKFNWRTNINLEDGICKLIQKFKG
tara:strand:+ start:2254 stop:3198 length:945 start_codon:yes stop_codon:yes gene_type:complete